MVDEKNLESQLQTSMIETMDGKHCICLNKNNKRFYGWIFKKHPDGAWVTVRMALPFEIRNAIQKKEEIAIKLGIPCQSC